jgi:hypothetical protein
LEWHLAGGNFTVPLILSAAVVFICVFARLWPSKRRSEKFYALLILGTASVAILTLVALWFGSGKQTRPQLIPDPSQVASVDAPTPFAPPKSDATVTEVKKTGPPTTLEICGIGKVPDDDDGRAEARESINRKLERARKRWLTAMLQSSDPRVRATGLLFESRFTMTEDWLTKVPPEKTVNSLVAIALSSQDPMIYAMAVYACAPVFGPAAGGECDQITAKAWADMDQDNAAAWSAAAREARRAKDKIAENADYSNAAKATRVDNYVQSFSIIAEPMQPSDLGPLEQYRLSYDFNNLANTLSRPLFGIYAPRCAAADAAVQSECRDMAALLLSKGTTVQDYSEGTAIAAQSGWPKERLAALKEKGDALQTLLMARATNRGEADPWSCDVANRGKAFLRDWQQFGELGAYERELEQSENTVAELAQEHKEFLLDMQRRIDELKKSNAQVDK